MTGHVVLVGAMATGKTTIGEALARQLGRPFLDSDRQIEGESGSEGSVLAATRGVDHLHELEWQALREALDSVEPSVIAAAASVIEHAEIQAAVEGSYVVWLRADADVLDDRRPKSTHRRELDPAESERIARREPAYAALADLTMDTTDLDPAEAAARVAREVGK